MILCSGGGRKDEAAVRIGETSGCSVGAPKGD